MVLNINNKMVEWKIIENYSNYSVSNIGTVKNNKTNKILRNNVKCGYSNITLTDKTNKKTFKVHRLVAFYFIENKENKMEVNHKNKNRLDNRVENLEWVTRIENNIHRTINLKIKNNRNKPIIRQDIKTNENLEKYN